MTDGAAPPARSRSASRWCSRLPFSGFFLRIAPPSTAFYGADDESGEGSQRLRVAARGGNPDHAEARGAWHRGARPPSCKGLGSGCASSRRSSALDSGCAQGTPSASTGPRCVCCSGYPSDRPAPQPLLLSEALDHYGGALCCCSLDFASGDDLGTTIDTVERVRFTVPRAPERGRAVVRTRRSAGGAELVRPRRRSSPTSACSCRCHSRGRIAVLLWLVHRSL